MYSELSQNSASGKSLLAFPARFVRWWFAELRGLLPAGLRRRLLPLAEIVLLREEGDALVLEALGDGARRALGSVALEAGEPRASARALRRLLQKAKLLNSEGHGYLPPSKVLTPELELPIEAAEKLPEILALEMDRQTPFSVEEVYFDYRVLDTDLDLQTLRVALQVAHKSDVRRLRGLLHDAGLRAVAVSAPRGRRSRGMAFNLLPSAERAVGGGAVPKLVSMMAILLLLATAGAVYLPLQSGVRALEASDRELRVLRGQAAELAELEEVLAAVETRRNHPVTAKAEGISTVELLADVTERMPDDSWLLQFTVRGGELRLAGYSDDPSNLIRLLDASPNLTEVGFGAPVTRDQRIGKDRFNLTAKIRKGGQP